MSEISDRLEELTDKQGRLLSNLESLDSDIRANFREPSKARLIGQGHRPGSNDDEGEGGEFIRALFLSRSQDYELQREGKAALAEMGRRYVDAKATLGDTGAAGGNIVPPNVLAEIVSIAAASNIYRSLLKVVSAGFVSGVDTPSEDIIPARAVVQGYGATKENVDWTASKYSATMYTIARIHDIGNQFLRNSRGAAQAEVISRLGRAIGLGEAYYILSGSGSSEPKGLLTSLAAAPASMTTNKGSATTTPATSISGTIITAIMALGKRAVTPTAIVTDPASYWQSFLDATTSFSVLGSLAGQAMSPLTLEGGTPRLYGIPYLVDPLMPANTGIVGDFHSAMLYTGQDYRVDVSDQAGTRWDKNETGFRGEEEIAFNGDAYVLTGHFQRLTGLNT